MPVSWYGNQVRATIRKGIKKNVNDAGMLLKRELKAVLSVPGRTVTYVKAKKSGKIRKKLGKIGSVRSRPGEPPRKQTGRLARSVYKRNKKNGAVRVGARGNLMEYGAAGANVLARPWLAPTLERLKPALAEILSRPI
jgi:hypothetical protein